MDCWICLPKRIPIAMLSLAYVAILPLIIANSLFLLLSGTHISSNIVSCVSFYFSGKWFLPEGWITPPDEESSAETCGPWISTM